MRSIVLASVVALLAGCDAVLGIEELPRAATMADASGVDAAPTPNEACISCETSGCTAARDACLADAACAPLLRCLEYCGQGQVTCRAACERVHAAGRTSKPFPELDLCRRKTCAEACFGGSGFGSAIESACACTDNLCGGKMLACVQSGLDKPETVGQCDRRLGCVAEKPNPDGWVDCVTDYLGSAEANELLYCLHTSPSCESCPLGDGAFGCLGKFTYAAAPKGVNTVTMTFGLETLDRVGIEGASVAPCAPAMCGKGCPTQGTTGVTGADGKVPLKLTMSEGGFDGCLHVEPVGDYMAMNIFPGRKIHRDEAMVTSYGLQEGLLAVYADQVKVPLLRDDAHGHVLIAIHDCLWQRVSGATVTMVKDPGDANTKLAYLDGLKVPPGLTATTGTGAAALINVPVGVHTIEVLRNGTVYARQQITVGPRTLTDVNMYPLDTRGL